MGSSPGRGVCSNALHRCLGSRRPNLRDMTFDRGLLYSRINNQRLSVLHVSQNPREGLTETMHILGRNCGVGR